MAWSIPTSSRFPRRSPARSSTSNPGGLRELHWHPTADEWQYVIEGNVSVTMFGSHGRYRTETLEKGDVGYIPQGYGHSIENIGDKPCRILIGFNTGVYETIDLSQWIAGNPPTCWPPTSASPRLCSRSSRDTTCLFHRRTGLEGPGQDGGGVTR